jgi:hypothetical protein
MEALFAATPMFFPDEFAAVVEEGCEIRIVWLVPITASEATFVRERGSDPFENLLMARTRMCWICRGSLWCRAMPGRSTVDSCSGLSSGG